MRLGKIAKDFNVGVQTLIECLEKRTGVTVEGGPNYNVSDEQYALLSKEFNKDKATLMEANFIMTDHPIVNEVISQNSVKRNLLTISVILTALTIELFVIGIILLW